MSRESVAQFFDKLGADEQLQQDLRQRVAEAMEQATIDCARAQGLQFGLDDLRAFQQDRASGELSDDDLAAVAGGASSTFGLPSSFKIFNSLSGIVTPSSTKGLLGGGGGGGLGGLDGL